MRNMLPLLLCIAVSANANAQQTAAGQPERIVTADEVRQAVNPGYLWPIRIVSAPCNLMLSGMQSGLASFENNRMRERIDLYRQSLARHGVTPLFGGLGEGAGFGLGLSYGLRMGERRPLVFLTRWSAIKNYQEFDLRWGLSGRKHLFSVEGSYQLRPQENFYGLGQDSEKTNRSNFALRQTWTGARYEFRPLGRIGIGAEYRLAWLSATDGKNTVYASTGDMFPGLPGWGLQTRLHTTGIYVDANGLRGDYGLGGRVNAGASFQRGLGSSAIEYFTYELRTEGRLPLAPGRGVLVGQGSAQLNRPSGGSDPIPFYLLPHIGGSSTMRGFAVDRFYGLNLLLVTAEYRYQIHPNFQTIIFFDEGQIFDRTSDLTWLNWHRNYGLGIRMHNVRGTVMRVEYGWGEGSRIHINFGDREERPLGGPIRYGSYRR